MRKRDYADPGDSSSLKAVVIIGPRKIPLVAFPLFLIEVIVGWSSARVSPGAKESEPQLPDCLHSPLPATHRLPIFVHIVGIINRNFSEDVHGLSPSVETNIAWDALMPRKYPVFNLGFNLHC
jgi:hypothetical protein